MKKISVFTISTLMLLLVICFSITGTVLSQGRNKSRIEAQYRDQMEDDYVEEVRDFLEKQHMNNSGINFTKTIYEDGQIAYVMTIHNRAIDHMSVYEQQKLMEQLEKITFPDTQSTVSHQFLEL